METLKTQMKELEVKDKEKTFELEQLKNRIHQYTNREGKLGNDRLFCCRNGTELKSQSGRQTEPEFMA